MIRVLVGDLARVSADAVVRPADAALAPAGAPGARLDANGETTAVSVVVEDGRITRIYAMRNPAKLGWLERVATLRR